MPEDISLLPKEVEKKREQEARGRLLRRVSFAVLGAALLFATSVFVYSLILKSQSSSLEQAVNQQKSEISSRAKVELTAHDLDARVEALRKVLGSKIYFSTLLTAVSRAVPGGVTVTEMTAPSEETASVSGTSGGYISLAKFLLNLKEAEAFEAVELRSVSLEAQTGEARFNLNLIVAQGGLQK